MCELNRHNSGCRESHGAIRAAPVTLRLLPVRVDLSLTAPDAVDSFWGNGNRNGFLGSDWGKNGVEQF